MVVATHRAHGTPCLLVACQVKRQQADAKVAVATAEVTEQGILNLLLPCR